ncbi:cardiolipin synthase [Luteimonas aquatica]|uniref:cardiolipin synthase n=1 Tax=Luteimonas aquatica TaxID=450364 RepID=UPI001F567357|nr:cardiolipin synthase [Luteimonas aquatica]
MDLPAITVSTLLLVADWLIRVAALFWIPTRSTPAAARSWLLLVGFVPLFGLPLYLAFGHPWLARQRRQRQSQASQFIREQQLPLAHLRWTPPGRREEGNLDDIARLAERLGDFMPMTGNAVTLLDRYDASLQSLLSDIEDAREEVHLLYYLMFDDAVGHAFADALRRAAARGVRCRVLLDAVGAKRGLRAFARPLRAAGVDVRAMLAGGLAWRRSSRMDLRNHRKIAVIDGRVGYTGSQNLAAPEFVRGFPNREVVARIEGAAVLQLAALFASDWYIETGEALAVATESVTSAATAGATPAQVLPSGPAYPFENARNLVVAAVQRAQRSVTLATPYFVPDDATLTALRVAALSGIDVQLILSRSNNQRLTAWAQTSYYEELLAAGVRIALYRPHFLHAKHLRVDGDVALVGSINLDIRSFALNAEVGVLCYDPAVAARLRAIEDDYLADADHVDYETWRRRPTWRRSREGIARLADSFL